MESPRASTLALLDFLGHHPTGQVRKFIVDIIVKRDLAIFLGFR